MNKRAFGLLLALVASAFFILGSGWIMGRAYLGTDWMHAHELGFIFGIPALLLSLTAWRFPTFGSAVATLLSGGLFLLCLNGAIFGDMEERMIWSVTAATGLFSLGALMVTQADKPRMNPNFYTVTASTFYIFASFIVMLLIILLSVVFQ